MTDLPPCYRCGRQPCECKDGITLYCADCRDVLPLLESGTYAAITDPVWPNCKAPLPGADRPYDLFAEMCLLLPHETKRLAVQLGCDIDPMLLACAPSELSFFRVCSLEYVRPSYKGRLMNTGDIAYLYGEAPRARKGAMIIPGRCINRDTASRKNGHPCPRRYQHVRWLVNWWSAESDLVLDPFAGSGTTGRACKDLGRRCIMVEIEQKYCDIIVERLRQEVLFR